MQLLAANLDHEDTVKEGWLFYQDQTVSSYLLLKSAQRALKWSKLLTPLAMSCRVFMPFDYEPRTRPQRPIVASSCFFAGIKATPEEWHQEIALMKTPPDAGLKPIHSHVCA